MNKTSFTLAVETSCDDTACAILKDNKVIVSLVYNQNNLHKNFGGIIPEQASRMHYELIDKIIQEALDKAQINLNQITTFAATTHPGMIGSLFIGTIACKTLAKLFNKPFIGINHLHAHIYSCFIEDEQVRFPAIGFVISGGHTSAYLLKKHLDFQLVAETKDDAIGECLDKVGKFIGLDYPAGPTIDTNAKKAHSQEFLQISKTSTNLNFSFSGVKTKLIQHFQKNKVEDINLACSLIQNTVFKIFLEKMDLIISKYRPKTILLCGGVSANSYLRMHLKERYFPYLKLAELKYCTDNAAMIGKLSYFQTIYNIKNASSNI